LGVPVELLGGDIGAPADLHQLNRARLRPFVEPDPVAAEQRSGRSDRPQLPVGEEFLDGRAAKLTVVEWPRGGF